MLTDEERRVLRALAAADGASFTDLVRIAQLDPAQAFRGADLRDVDFGESDLFGYDFTEADLSGANLEHATIAGAIFTHCLTTRTRWPRPSGAAEQSFSPVINRNPSGRPSPPDVEESPTGALTEMQQHAAEQMFSDLMGKRRALVLMPARTGRGAVLEEVICKTVWDGGYVPILLLVNTVVEREHFAHRLRSRLGPSAVEISRTVRELGQTSLLSTQVTVSNATYRDLNQLDRNFSSNLFSKFPMVLTTALEKVVQLERKCLFNLNDLCLGSVDSLPIAINRPDRRQFEARMHRLFGNASFVLEVEEAIYRGLLKPVRILRMHQDWYHFRPQKRGGAGFNDYYNNLHPIAEEIWQLFTVSKLASLFVLAKDDRELTALRDLLEDYRYFSPGMLTRLGGRWSEGRLSQPVHRMSGIILASVSQQSMEAARRHPHVAVATPLSVARAQDLAYRPPGMMKAGEARLYDLADAFSDFPNLEQL